jgi:hypothetical protein
VRVQRWFSDLSTQIHTFLREANVSERVADDLMAVPPAQMRYRSADELVAYRLDMSIPRQQNHRPAGGTQARARPRDLYAAQNRVRKLCRVVDPSDARNVRLSLA